MLMMNKIKLSLIEKNVNWIKDYFFVLDVKCVNLFELECIEIFFVLKI